MPEANKTSTGAKSTPSQRSSPTKEFYPALEQEQHYEEQQGPCVRGCKPSKRALVPPPAEERVPVPKSTSSKHRGYWASSMVHPPAEEDVPVPKSTPSQPLLDQASSTVPPPAEEHVPVPVGHVLRAIANLSSDITELREELRERASTNSEYVLEAFARLSEAVNKLREVKKGEKHQPLQGPTDRRSEKNKRDITLLRVLNNMSNCLRRHIDMEMGANKIK